MLTRAQFYSLFAVKKRLHLMKRILLSIFEKSTQLIMQMVPFLGTPERYYT
jgi:hypothetical protein